MAERPPVGLPSIKAAREDRARGRYNRPTTSLLLAAIAGVAATLVAYNWHADNSLEARKKTLLEKQRAVQLTVGAEWTPLRDKLEAITLADGKDFQGDFVDQGVLGGAKPWDFRSRPGVYLRVRVGDTKDVNTLRTAIEHSSRDAFAACFLREPAPADLQSDAGVDEIAAKEQPWNLWRGYAATRILTDAWIADAKAADDDLRLRVFEGQFDKATRDDIPTVVKILKQAEFFLLVLDQDENGQDEPTLQLKPHPTRVHLVNLTTGNEAFRLERSAEGAFMMGSNAAIPEETKTAMQRQVNNCELANEVNAAITK